MYYKVKKKINLESSTQRLFVRLSDWNIGVITMISMHKKQNYFIQTPMIIGVMTKSFFGCYCHVRFAWAMPRWEDDV